MMWYVSATCLRAQYCSTCLALAEMRWDILEGTRKDTGADVSVFRCPIDRLSAAGLSAARAGLHRCKTLRHPQFLSCLDAVETKTELLFATDPVVPLSVVLESESIPADSAAWGVHNVLTGLQCVPLLCV
jgi:SCY1-like protein 1